MTMNHEQLALRVESQEHAHQELARWLAGMFEVGGSMGLSLRKKPGRPVCSVRPWIVFTTNREPEAEWLKVKFGGTKWQPKPEEQSWCWTACGELATSIASSMAPHAPFRQSHITAFEEWGKATTLAEQIQLALSLKERNRNPVYPSPVDYQGLVNQPSFIAGAFESRGKLLMREAYEGEKGYGWTFPVINLRSQNRPLVEALKKKFGGKIYSSALAGRVCLAKGRLTTPRADSFDWRIIRKPDVLDFLLTIHPYLIFQQEEIGNLLKAIHTL